VSESKLSDWIQIIASLGVVLGLLLITLEIRETNRVTLSEGSRHVSGRWADLSKSGYESDIYDLLTKSVENPEELSLAEILKLDAYFTSLVQTFDMWMSAYELGTARFDGAATLEESVNFYFGSKFGRAWFNENRYWIRPSIAEIIEAELDTRSTWDVPEYVERIKSEL